VGVVGIAKIERSRTSQVRVEESGVQHLQLRHARERRQAIPPPPMGDVREKSEHDVKKAEGRGRPSVGIVLDPGVACFDGTLQAGVQLLIEARPGPAVSLAQHPDHVRATVVDLSARAHAMSP
jgi:hypothetical protein